MGVTDKAVSKWERDLSYPDISSLPKLSQILGVSVGELIRTKADAEPNGKIKKIDDMIHLIFKCIALAMGIGVTVLSVLKTIDIISGFTMLGIGLFCLATLSFKDGKHKD